MCAIDFRALGLTLLFSLAIPARAESPVATAANPANDGRAAGAEAKLPLPGEAAQKAAQTLIADLYKSDYDNAKSSAQRLELAKKLFQVGLQTQADASGRFVLMRIARDMALRDGDVSLSLETIDAIEKFYDVDAVEMTTEALTSLSANAAATSAGRAELAAAFQKQIEQAIAKADFPLAKKLGQLAITAARNSKDPALLKTAIARGAEIERAAAAYADVQQALLQLAKTPADPAANLLVGRFQCFEQGKWSDGLPKLAKGSDANLKVLAEKELSRPTGAAACEEIGDGWWAAAEREAGFAKMRLRHRAAEFYRQALPGLSGVAKALVEKRLAEIGDAAPRVVDNELAAATTAGLHWLAKQQKADGSWDFDVAPDHGTPNLAIAATAMGLLPLLRSGSIQKGQEYKAAVDKGLAYLLGQMQLTANGGDLRGKGSGSMYYHGLASMALCEACAFSKNKNLQLAAQRSVDFIVAAQDPQGGGWRYAPRQPGDTCVTGFQLSALKLAANAKLKVPPQTLTKASHFLDSVESKDGGNYGYVTPGAGIATTAIGLYWRIDLGSSPQNPVIKKGIKSTLALGPAASDPYFNYYVTLLMHEAGGDEWKQWRGNMRQTLLDAQLPAARKEAAGSWSMPKSSVGMVGGSLGVTSLCLLTMQTLAD